MRAVIAGMAVGVLAGGVARAHHRESAQNTEAVVNKVPGKIPHHNDGRKIRISYQNCPGEVSVIEIVPKRFRCGKHERHLDRVVLLDALDVELNTERTFVLQDILVWEPLEIEKRPEPVYRYEAPSEAPIKGKKKKSKVTKSKPGKQSLAACASGSDDSSFDVDVGDLIDIASSDIVQSAGSGILGAISDFVSGIGSAISDIGSVASDFGGCDFGGGFGD